MLLIRFKRAGSHPRRTIDRITGMEHSTTLRFEVDDSFYAEGVESDGSSSNIKLDERTHLRRVPNDDFEVCKLIEPSVTTPADNSSLDLEDARKEVANLRIIVAAILLSTGGSLRLPIRHIESARRAYGFTETHNVGERSLDLELNSEVR
jgi:hypothetical protein